MVHRLLCVVLTVLVSVSLMAEETCAQHANQLGRRQRQRKARQWSNIPSSSRYSLWQPPVPLEASYYNYYNNNEDYYFYNGQDQASLSTAQPTNVQMASGNVLLSPDGRWYYDFETNRWVRIVHVHHTTTTSTAQPETEPTTEQVKTSKPKVNSRDWYWDEASSKWLRYDGKVKETVVVKETKAEHPAVPAATVKPSRMEAARARGWDYDYSIGKWVRIEQQPQRAEEEEIVVDVRQEESLPVQESEIVVVQEEQPMTETPVQESTVKTYVENEFVQDMNGLLQESDQWARRWNSLDERPSPATVGETSASYDANWSSYASTNGTLLAQICDSQFSCSWAVRGPCHRNEMLVDESEAAAMGTGHRSPSCATLTAYPWDGCSRTESDRDPADSPSRATCALRFPHRPCFGYPADYRYYRLTKTCYHTTPATLDVSASDEAAINNSEQTENGREAVDSADPVANNTAGSITVVTISHHSSPCDDDQVFTAIDGVYGECRCSDRYKLHSKVDNKCHHVYTKGPCKDGEWLEMDWANSFSGLCRRAPCPARKCDGQHIYWRPSPQAQGGCYRSHSRGPCARGSYFHIDDLFLQTGSCVTKKK